MPRPIDEATSQYLTTAADDLQRQLGLAGIVERMALEESRNGVELVATVRIGYRQINVRGSGDNLLAAYADLRQAVPEPVLAAALRELVETRI